MKGGPPDRPLTPPDSETSDLLEGVSGIADLFARAFEDPTLRPGMLLTWRLIQLQEDTRAALRELGVPLVVLTEGFDSEALKEWFATTTANEAERQRLFGVLMFNQDLQEASAALERGDYLSLAATLASHVQAPFERTERTGGRKRMVTPLIQGILQAWAEYDWQQNSRLRKSQLAKKYQPMLAWFHEELRWEGQPPAVRTIRSYIQEPTWLKARRSGK